MRLLPLLLLVGCASNPLPDYPCPDRPDLMPIPVDLQIRTPPDVIWIVTENQLALKAYAQKLEARAGCENR